MRVICSAVLIAASTAIGMTDVYAQGIEYGKNDYGKFCADCHGATGKGDGKFAKSLKRAPMSSGSSILISATVCGLPSSVRQVR